MKKILFFICILQIAGNILQGQIPYPENPSTVLYNLYRKEICKFAVQQQYQQLSPDTNSATIPQAWKDTILSCFDAVLHSGFAEADSVFNLFCVHDRSWDHHRYADKRFMVGLDTTVEWTSAWMNLIPLTTNTYLNQLVMYYGIKIVSFNNFGSGPYQQWVIIETDEFLNADAMCDTLMKANGIPWAQGDCQFLPLDGKISYHKEGAFHYLDFKFEWNCTNEDGCWNSRTWKFSVNNQWQTHYLGFDDFWGLDWLPLPEPENCNPFPGIGINDPITHHVSIYPVPVTDKLTFSFGTIYLKNATLHIYDFQGRIVLSVPVIHNRFEVDLKSFNPGVFFYSCSNDKNFIIGSGKFVKQ